MKLKHMLLALIPLYMASCSEEENIASGKSQREVRVTASASTQSRVVLSDEGDHISSLWESGDKISLFTATQSNLVYSTDANTATASFAPVDEALQDIEGNTVYACYPETNKTSDEGIVVNLPSTATMDYDNGTIRSFGYATSTISDGSVNFQFKYISAFIGLDVKPEMLSDATKGISRITVSTSSSQSLSVGEGDTFDFSTLTANTTHGTNTVQINVDNHVVDSLWTVYIPVLPQPAGADITISLTDSEDQTLYTQTKQTPESGFLAGHTYHQKAVEVAEAAYLTYGTMFNDRVKQLANDMVNGSDDRTRLITSIKFVTEDNTTPPATHVTVNADNSPLPIYATYNPTDSLLTIFTPAKNIEIEDASYMFFEFHALRSIDFGNFRVNERTTNMTCMFQSCISLPALDVSNWNTENVIHMHKMFEGCLSLTTLDVSNWNVGKAELMYQTFALCNSLTTMDVSNWNTESVVDMCWMFDSCTSLTTLDVSNWNVEKVGNMEGMFINCESLVSLDVSNWNTSNVANMAMMFEKCSSLTTLDVSKWDVGKLEATRQMFDGCSSLTALDVSNWNTQSLKGLQATFINCSSLKTLEVGNWNVANVESFGGEAGWGGTFEGCSSLTTLDVSNWNTQQARHMGQMFKNCTALTTLDVSNWNTENAEGMHEMFFRCHSLTNLDVSNWKVDKVTNMATMFGECYALQALDVANWNTANVDNMSSMFSGCKKLTSLEVSNWDVSNVTDIHFMFGDCSGLTSLNLANWDVTKANGAVSGIFRGCSALQTLDLSGWNTANVTGFHEMFMGCHNLSKLDISNWTINHDTGKYMEYYDMFSDCASTSQACRVISTQATKEALLNLTGANGMNPAWFIWEDATNNGTETFSIVGTWEMTEGDMDEWTIIFREDGTGIDSWTDEGEQDEYEFTYTLDWENRKLYTQVPGEESMAWEIVVHSDTQVTLRYSFDGGTVEYVFKKIELSYSPNEYNGYKLDNPIACSVDGSSSYNNSYQWVNIIDNNTWDYGYIKPGQVMEINFGKVVNLTSFYINNYSSSYAATGLKLETSADGSKWNNWGEVSYEERGTYYINLSAAEDVQYMRIVFTGGGFNDQGIEIDGLVFYGNK